MLPLRSIIELATVGLLTFSPLFAAPDHQLLVGSLVNAGFGQSIAGGDFDGDGFADLVVAEPVHPGKTPREGRLRLYRGGPDGMVTNAAWIATGNSISAFQFGARITNVGDVNGDGCQDLLVLACRPQTIDSPGSYPQGLPPPNVALLYSGKTLGPMMTPAWEFDSRSVSNVAGIFPHRLSDLDHDGFDDFALGLTRATVTNTCEGCGVVQVVWGGAFPFTSPRVSAVPGTGHQTSFGWSVAPYPDIGGDGIDDVIIGSPAADFRFPKGGKAELWTLHPTQPPRPSGWSVGYPWTPRRGIDADREQLFSYRLANVGDTDGDGWPELVITAPYADAGDIDEGVVALYRGQKAGPAPTPQWVLQGDQQYGVFGWGAGGVGDVNGDGFADTLITAYAQTHGQLNEGIIYLFTGSRDGVKRQPSWNLEGERVNDRLGQAWCALGDVNRDGFADFAVASPEYTEGEEPIGRVQIFFGSPTGPGGSSNIAFGKTLSRQITDEWNRLSTVQKSGATATLAMGIVALAIGARRNWKRRTVVLVEKRASEERRTTERRIARNLHDEIGSRLSSISLLVEQVQRDIHNPGAALTHTTSLSARAHDLRTALEQLVTILKTDASDLEGLIEVVSRQTDAFLSGTGIQSLQSLPLEVPTVRLPEGIRRELLPCLRESLANVLRHSSATEVWLRVCYEADHLRVEIEDNGRGFLLSEIKRGHGLDHLHARMEEVGGRCQVVSSPGQGTKVTLEVALSSLPPADDPPPGFLNSISSS